MICSMCDWQRAMYSKLKIFVLAYYVSITRSFVILLGCGAMLWGIIELPAFWQDSAIQRMANQIIAGEEFKNDTLIQQIAAVESMQASKTCRPRALRSAAIVRLRLFETTEFANAQERSDAASNLVTSIRNSLACSPADAFLWFADYFIGVNEKGVEPEFFDALRQSYRVGPREGWVAIKRNRVAFAGFANLPSDLREAAINEFVDMLHDKHFYGFAADILIGPAWPERDVVLLELSSRLNDGKRADFYEALKARGYVRVPGFGLAPVDSHRFARPVRVPH